MNIKEITKLTLGCMLCLTVNYASAVTPEKQELLNSMAVQAYVWGYPAVITGVTEKMATSVKKPMPTGYAPLNQLGNVDKLITPADKTVVSPNSDTVYSSAFLDLKMGDISINVPKVTDRYFSFQILDLYTNSYAYIGSRSTHGKAGHYLIVGPESKTTKKSGATIIKSPTNQVWVIVRTLVRSPEDMNNVRNIQKQYKLTLTNINKSMKPFDQRLALPALKPGVPPVYQVEQMTTESYFTWMTQLMNDSPIKANEIAYVNQFRELGINVKQPFDYAKLSDAQKQALDYGMEHGLALLKAEAKALSGLKHNGWTYNLDPSKWGNWGDYYLDRGVVAIRSLGQNRPDEAIYYNNREDSTAQPLSGENNYVIHFNKKDLPPADGFWSITMYNNADFFVDNEINRYSIGDQTKGMKYNADGSLDLYIQNKRPSEDKISNWLPSPEKETFRLALRLYVPRQAAIQNQWQPAAAIKQ